MRSIAIINQKGGVGKTTSAVNIAAGLVQAEKRVLLIDLDPQAHACLHLGVELDGEATSIYDVLVGGAPLAEAAIYASEKLAMVPSHIDLVAAEGELSAREDRERLLTRALEPHTPNFDALIIDCAPSLGLLTVNALAAVQEVFIPVQPHFFALQGLGKLFETVTLVREHINPALRVSGIILCMYEKTTRLAQEVRNDISEFLGAAEPTDAWHGARLFDTVIRRNVKLAECPSYGESIFSYAPTSNGAEDYAALTREILAMSNGEARADEAPDVERVVQEASAPRDEVVVASDQWPSADVDTESVHADSSSDDDAGDDDG